MSRYESPTQGWPAIERQHGRVVWRGENDDTWPKPALRVVAAEPIEEPTVPDTWESPLWAQKAAELEMDKRRKVRLLKWLLLVFGAALLGGLVAGCAHEQPARPKVVVLSERAGTAIAKTIGALVAQEPKATTIAGVIVVFQPGDAQDVCLIGAHEGCHAEDEVNMGTLAFLIEYQRQYIECRETQPPEVCARSIPLEARCYDIQHACQRARAEGKPWPAVSLAPRWRDGWGMCMTKGGRR